MTLVWLTWWVGDTLGLLVAFPLTLVLLGDPHPLWRSRAPTVALPMLLLFGLLVIFFLKVSQWEHEENLLEYHRTSQSTAERIQARFEEQVSLLEQLSALFQTSRRVSRQDFHGFMGKSLSRFPMIRAVEWAPRVTLQRRSDFEAATRLEVPGFEIRERGPDDQLTRAGQRTEYYPVTYVEPLAGNEPSRGFDLASGASRRAALQHSIATGMPVTTAAIRLVQEQGPESSGLLLFMPVYSGASGPGVVLTVIEMRGFMERLLADSRSKILVRLEDLDDQQTLYSNFSPDTRADFETHIEFGTRHYRLQTAPTPLYLAQHKGWQSWGVLVAGILGTALLGGLLLLSTGHTARVEALAIERTQRLADRESQLKDAQRMAHVGSWDHDLQQDILLWSDEIYRIFELSPQSPPPSLAVILSTVHPKDRDLVEQFFAAARHKRAPYDLEHRLLLAEGRIKYVRVHGETLFGEHGLPVRTVGTVQDVTERRQAEDSVRQAAEEVEDLYNNAPCGYHSLNADGIFLRINNTELDWLGYTREEVIGKLRLADIITPESRLNFEQEFANLKQRGWARELELEVIRKNGTTFSALINATAIVDAEGHFLRSRSSVFDITERKQAQEQIRQLAYYDPLTELPNRRLLLDRLQQAVAQARHFRRAMAVMFLDLDHFKAINDTLGHDAGDELLKTVAKRISTCLRSGDTVSRQGGDEFVIVLAEIAHPQDAAVVADKIIATLSQPVLLKGKEQCITTSIGIAVYPVDGTDDVLALMKKADAAMYAAKEGGRNRYCFHCTGE